MDYTDWLIIKFIGICAIAFFANFFYTLFTGKDLGQAMHDREEARRSQQGD